MKAKKRRSSRPGLRCHSRSLEVPGTGPRDCSPFSTSSSSTASPKVCTTTAYLSSLSLSQESRSSCCPCCCWRESREREAKGERKRGPLEDKTRALRTNSDRAKQSMLEDADSSSTVQTLLSAGGSFSEREDFPPLSLSLLLFVAFQFN